METSAKMANPELINSLSTLSRKIDALLENQKKLRETILNLKNENRELKLMHQSDAEKIRNAEKEIEFLSISYKLAASPEDLISARNKVSALIRTIDSCIRLIKED